MKHRHEYYVALGSNLGYRAGHLLWAVAYLNNRGEVIRTSNRYANPPEGFDSDEVFENAAVRWQTNLDPEEALAYLLRGERLRGRPPRTSGQAYSDRLLDLDLLMWSGGVWQSDRLTLPHCRMRERAFVMVPLAEIHPQGGTFELPEGVEKMERIGSL